MTAATFAEPFTGETHDDFVLWAREVRDTRIELAHQRPAVMLYDGDWIYRGTVYGENAGGVHPVVNDTGTIQLARGAYVEGTTTVGGQPVGQVKVTVTAECTADKCDLKCPGDACVPD